MAHPEAYLRLKKLHGIRNRFWTRAPERLRPLMERAHRDARVRRHLPLYLALLAAERSRGAGHTPDQTRQVAFARLAHSLTRLRSCGLYSLRDGQACAMLTAHQGCTLIVRNTDGSLDAEARRRLLAVMTAALTEPLAGAATGAATSAATENKAFPGDASTVRERARGVLAHSLAARDAEPSPSDEPHGLTETAQLLGSLLPGMPLLLRLFDSLKHFTEMHRDGGDAKTTLRLLLQAGTKEAVQASVSAILAGLRGGAELAGPAAAVAGWGMDRLASTQRSLQALEKGKAALLPLLLHYSGKTPTEHMKKTVEDGAAGTESERAALRALLLPER